jgi:poly-gamma-glutamate synthesis protein (capsule biosynthesis protein)
VRVTLVVVPLIALALAGSCVGQRMPLVVRIHAEAPLADRAVAAAGELLAARQLPAELVLDPEAAHLTITTTGAEGGVPFVMRYWNVAAALPSAVDALSTDELIDAITGGARVLIPLDPAPPVGLWFPDQDVTVVEPLPLAEIPTALAADASALALLPLEAVDARTKSVALDGVDLVFGEGDAAAYPLVDRGYVAVADDDFGGVLDGVAAELAARLSVAPPAPIVLRATGDILPVRCAYARMAELGDLAHAFRELGSWLGEADITVGSLDAAISDAGVPFGCVETFSLLGPAATAEGLELSGFDVMTVATNHVKDCGQEACGDQAFFDTLANLRAAGIAPVGGGADLAEARAPAVLTVRGVRFAFLGYDEIAPYYHAEAELPGTAPLDEAYLREDVAAAAVGADVVVVLPQWGVEYTADPTPGQRALARAAVEAGAGLVIGNHPHWVQAAEVIDGAFVAYALGNFVFDQDWSRETQQGVVLDAAFHGAMLRGVRYHPVRIIDEHQPVFAEPEEAREILERIWNASAALE